MLDKYLKIFGLDNNFSLDKLEEKHKELLKEFDTKNIEDDLKIIFLEEQVKIREAYQILLKYYYKQEKVSSIKSKGKTLHVKAGTEGEKKKMLLIIMTICALLLLALGFSGVFTAPATEEVVVEEVVVEDESIDVDSIIDEVLEEVEEVVKRKPTVSPPVNTCNIKHKSNTYWGTILNTFDRLEGKDKKKDELEVIVNRESATITSYTACGCPKCKTALKDKNLKIVKTFFAEYKESFGDDRGWTQSDRSLLVKTCQQGWGAYTQESKDYCECIVIKCMKEWDSLEEMNRDITFEEKDMDEWVEACMLEITKR
tara:strand:- start:812 stop:1750 length:939 start_codon:yes stop_codon:yes gene_type:complete